MNMETQSKHNIDGLEYTEADILHFENGLPGFEELHKYVLSSNPDHEPFQWLHSIEDPNIRFVVINPMLVNKDYNPKLSSIHLESLGPFSPETLLFFCIVTLDRQNLANSTANMAGPLVVNVSTQKGKQIILDDQRYGIRSSILGGN